MTKEELKKNCEYELSCIVQHGKLICPQFVSELGMRQCKYCGYSRYWHLIKRIATELE